MADEYNTEQIAALEGSIRGSKGMFIGVPNRMKYKIGEENG